VATQFGRVVEVRRYPVKSMLGERLAAVAVDRRGLAGDRRWAVRDPDGKLGSGKTSRRFVRMDGLLRFSARDDGGVPVVTFPDGRAVRADDPTVHTRLAAALGRQRVELAPEAAVSHFDAAPVHLCTTASLDHLARLQPGPRVDRRRFRPNLVVEVPGRDRFVEDGWVGRRLAVGPDLQLEVTERTERCVMVTMAQEDLADDPRVLRAVADHNDICLGVYAEVARPGRVAVGDEVRLARA
jgi:uncharacterized protein